MVYNRIDNQSLFSIPTFKYTKYTYKVPIKSMFLEAASFVTHIKKIVHIVSLFVQKDSEFVQ